LTPYEIIVVAGIIQKNEKYLIAQRKKDLNGGGFWEFPGGKVEPGENHSQALVRELKEELDIEAELGDFFGENIVQFGEKKYHLYAYHIKKYIGEPKLIDHDDMRWVRVEEFASYQFIEGDKVFIKKLMAL
jgi:mutator protein MutT